jgi:hypothetical protein
MKQGKWPELEALFKAERERYGSMFDRICICQIGNRGRLVVEHEFQDMAEMLKKEAEFRSSPEFGEAFVALTEPGTTREVWRVE